MQDERMHFRPVQRLVVNFADLQSALIRDPTMSVTLRADQDLEVNIKGESYPNTFHNEALQALARVPKTEVSEGLADT